MDNVQAINGEPCEDWYEALISAQPEGVGLDETSRDKFNQAFESFTIGSYGHAYTGFVELSEAGSSISQFYLGLMYLHGMGVLQDFCRAHRWLNIASSQGHKKARTQLEQLTRKMTADQIAKAQKRARRLMAKKEEELVTD